MPPAPRSTLATRKGARLQPPLSSYVQCQAPDALQSRSLGGCMRTVYKGVIKIHFFESRNRATSATSWLVQGKTVA